jgi:hypothetical protein
MQILENGVPLRARQMIDRGNCIFCVIGAVIAPCRQQRRSQIGDRPSNRLGKITTRARKLLMLELADAENQSRNPVALVSQNDTLPELDGFIDVTIDEKRQKCTVQQLAVVRISF